MEPCIVKCLEASTGHISRDDNELLAHASEEGAGLWSGPVVYAYDEGYFIYVSLDEKEYFDQCMKDYLEMGFSSEFVELLRKARTHGCKYLQLDRDATIYEDLPRFAW